MEILLLRHAEANHLLENWHQKVCYHKFNQLMQEWEDVPLTLKGEKQAEQTALLLNSNFDMIISSPLKRTIQTAKFVNQSNCKILFEDLLKEIRIHPPAIFKNMTFSINKWILICTFFSFFNGEFHKAMKQAKDLFDIFIASDCKRLLVVSHSARIQSLVFFARFCSYLQLVSHNFKPCGLSVIRFDLLTQSRKFSSQEVNPNI